MKKWLTILFLLSVVRVMAQPAKDSKTDSLRKQLAIQAGDSNKVVTWINLANTFSYKEEGAGIPALDSALQLATRLGWLKGIARAEGRLGVFIGDTGNNMASNAHFLKAIDIDKKTGDKKSLMAHLSNLARAYNRESDFPNALKTGLQSLDIAENLHDDTLICSAIGNIVITYLHNENYSKGVEWALKGKALAEKLKLKSSEVDYIQYMAYATQNQGKKKETVALMREAVDVSRTLNEPSTLADMLSQLGEAEADSPAIALQHLFESRKIYQNISPNALRYANTLTMLGEIFEDTAIRTSGAFRRALLDSAIETELHATRILIKSNNRRQLSAVYKYLGKFEGEAGNYRSAYDYDLKFAAISDSLYSQSVKDDLAGMQDKHDLEIRDEEIAVRKLEVADQRRKLIGLISGFFLLIVIAVLLIRENRNRRKTIRTLLILNGRLDEANKVKARFFGILSHDLRRPVANLLSYLRTQKTTPDSLSGEQKELRQRDISQSSEELLETMEAMLLWSKEQMDSFRPDVREIPVSALFGYLEKFFAGEETIRISFGNPENLVVTGDENYLRVIMQNLTSNALKVLRNHPNGLIKWTVAVHAGRTILSITDNGPGLNEEQTQRLFSEPTDASPATGLGFQLVRDLAKAIRFTITVDSTPGQGTRFGLAS